MAATPCRLQSSSKPIVWVKTLRKWRRVLRGCIVAERARARRASQPQVFGPSQGRPVKITPSPLVSNASIPARHAVSREQFLHRKVARELREKLDPLIGGHRRSRAGEEAQGQMSKTPSGQSGALLSLKKASRGAVQNCLLKNLMQTPQANVEKLGRFDDRVRAWINSGRS